MPTSTTNPLPVPPVTFPVIDPTTGQFRPEWYAYIVSLDKLVRALRLEIP